MPLKSHTSSLRLHSHKHEYESDPVGVPIVHFNGSTVAVHIHTSAVNLQISLVRVVSVQVVFISNPCKSKLPTNSIINTNYTSSSAYLTSELTSL